MGELSNNLGPILIATLGGVLAMAAPLDARPMVVSHPVGDQRLIRVVVKIERAELPEESVQLRIESTETVSVPALRVVPFSQSDTPLVVVFVLEDYLGWPPTLDGLTRGWPLGSRGKILTYPKSIDISASFGDRGRLEELNPALEPRSLLDAVEIAGNHLAGIPAHHRVLVLVGRGVEPGVDMADVARVRRELRAGRIETYAIHDGNDRDQDRLVSMKYLGYSGSFSSRNGFEGAPKSIAKRINTLYQIDFEPPGSPFSKADVQYTVVVDGEDVATKHERIIVCGLAEHNDGSTVILYVIGLLTLVTVHLIFVMRRRSRRKSRPYSARVRRE